MASHHSLQRQRGALHGFTVLQNGLTRRGQRQAIWSSTQQLCVELLLEGCDSASDRDVIHGERLGCARKTPLARRGQKEANIVPPPVDSHNCSLLHIKCEGKTMFTVSPQAYRIPMPLLIGLKSPHRGVECVWRPGLDRRGSTWNYVERRLPNPAHSHRSWHSGDDSAAVGVSPDDVGAVLPHRALNRVRSASCSNDR